MIIIISPAKKMNMTESLPYQGQPVFLEQAEELMGWIRSLSYSEAKALWKCNDHLAELNFLRFQEMDLGKALSPAILAYEGIQYQYMAPSVFEEKSMYYVQSHLRILSGFYGVLKPFDGVVSYRLEMQAKAKVAGKKDLYEYWGERIYQEVTRDTGVILNLASKEYSRCVERYLKPGDEFVTCVFGEMQAGKVVQKGTLAKMARGEMVRFLAEIGAEKPEQAKAFNRLGYAYCGELSKEREYVFLKKAE